MKHRIWIALALPPITFLTLLYLDREAGAPLAAPFVLMANHALVFALIVHWLRKDGLSLPAVGWRASPVDLLIGAAAGIVLFFAAKYALSPVATSLAALGKSVDAGFLLPMSPTRSSGVRIGMFVHALVFAPVVEEVLYRGYAITVLGRRYGTTVAIIVSSLFFGILHVRLGLEAMIETALLGFLLAAVVLWRRSVVSAVIAHAVVNLMSLLIT